MTHQRLALILLSTLPLVACGGGTGNDVSTYDPNTSPKISDQQPVTSSTAPPSSTLPPDGSGSSGEPTPGGGGSRCERVCERALAAGCQIEEGADCMQVCAELPAQACGNQLLDAFECVTNAGVCIDSLASNPAVVAQCDAQITAFTDCQGLQPNN
ncbi:MAG: hypothetical protein QM756_22745 [Polyangiaceae bacterium]